MGLIQAFTGAISGTFADQWKDIITVANFDEYTVVAPAVLQQSNRGRGSNYSYSEGVISNGSKIYIPENTAAFIFSQSGIEEIITTAGGYEYQSGQKTIFNDDGIKGSIINQAIDRFGYGGQTSDRKIVVFINLREIRNIKFGTRGPVIYNDLFYGTDLEVQAYGVFSIKVISPEIFIKNFIPANVTYYSFADPKVRKQIISEFIHSFIDTLNTLSTTFRISQLPSQVEEITDIISKETSSVGTWKERFGFELTKIAIENIELTDESKELVKQYSSNKMNMKAYEDISHSTSNIASQQKVAQGIQDHGLGDGGGMIFGMNVAQSMNSNIANNQQTMTLDEQVDAVKKLKELVDTGILSQEEFDKKKKEILGL